MEDEMKASPNRVRYVNSLSGICVFETVESITYPSTCINPETDKIRKKKEESISFLFQMVLFCMKNKHSKKKYHQT